MAEYISRKEALENWPLCDEPGDAYQYIKNLPAADVRPVVKGKWTKELHPNVRYNQYKCSICGGFSGHDSEGWIWKPNYCPNCVAMMEENK